ncbi:hypothetical protein [Pseudomonas sp. CGJS7]|uniref:hypothetical protein n=1 Tax=Pseudomonas sp. CGJS7 TaxID=3109348 RepID=UPI00300B31FE
MLSFARTILHSLSAMIAAAVVVVLTNEAGGRLAAGLGMPPGGDLRLAWDLAWAVAGGLLAIAVATRCAPVAPRAHGAVCGGLIAALAVYAVVELGGDFPLWFRAMALLSLPLQVWLGLRIGKRRKT